jgi:DNA-binding NtrC family response regulator
VPPLRERAEEIEPLILKFTQVQAESMRRVPPAYASEVMDILQCHSWPGNVRELKNIVTRLIIVFSGKTVVRGDIEPLLNLQQNVTPIDQRTLDEVERAHLIKVLNLTKGVVGGKKGAAAFLKMPKSTLQYKLRTHGLNPQDFS